MSGIEDQGNDAVDWDLALTHIENMGPGPDTDASIDLLLRQFATGSQSPSFVAVRLLRLSSSEFTIQRAARAVALTAGPDDQDAVDALLDTYKAKRDDGFLGLCSST